MVFVIHTLHKNIAESVRLTQLRVTLNTADIQFYKNGRCNKKGDKSTPANYRPVSLTCILCKLMEHVVYSQMGSHLDNHDILHQNQHGFRKGLSCETQLVGTIQDWASSINSKGQTDVILLDFSKAFDKVSHRKLLHKIHHYGVRGED